MTQIDFTPARPIDVAAIECEARKMRAEFLRSAFRSAIARVATLLRGTPAPQA